MQRYEPCGCPRIILTGILQGKITSEEAKEARDRVTVVGPEKGLAGVQDVDMVVEVRIKNSGNIKGRNAHAP